MKTDQISAFRNAMPAMLAHKGQWKGTYRHLDDQGNIIDQHRSDVICEFPDNGPYAYIQYNHFTWPDGRESRSELPGVYRENRLWWDTETFRGCAWETHDGLVLLNLERKDEPGARFFEIIIMGETGDFRSRTWHWFKQGRLYKRTLCEETRMNTD